MFVHPDILHQPCARARLGHMSLWLIAVLGVLVLGNLGLLFLMWRRMHGGAQKPQDTQGMLLLQNQIENLTRAVDQKIAEGTKQMSDSVRAQFSESQRLVKEVTEGLISVRETGRQMLGSMDKLEELQNILKNPKQRGILGEYYLETLLKNVLPPGSYQAQYAFRDGTIVDAAVFVKDKIIPIDSKFSLENYNRLVEERDPLERERLEKLFKQDLKNRIDETAKYVKPAEGTMDFAFMFIPHEAIYYDLLISQVGALKVNTRDLIEYAFRDKRVIIVSPTSFLAYLQTVLQGLKALQIEEKVGDVVKRVGELGKHLKAYEDYHAKLGNAIGTAVNHYNASGKEFKKIDKDVLRITGAATGLEVPTLERPPREEEA